MDISYHSHTISSGVFPFEGESYKKVHTFNCLSIIKPIAHHLLLENSFDIVAIPIVVGIVTETQNLSKVYNI